MHVTSMDSAVEINVRTQVLMCNIVEGADKYAPLVVCKVNVYEMSRYEQTLEELSVRTKIIPYAVALV